MAVPVIIYFCYRLVFTGDRTLGRHSYIGIEPGPVIAELEHSLETLVQDENLAAVALHKVELQFIEWVMENHPEHTLASWKAKLSSPDGPVLSHYWSGFYASE